MSIRITDKPVVEEMDDESLFFINQGEALRQVAKTDVGLIPFEVAGKSRIKPDGTFQLWNATQDKWHSITITGAIGEEGLNIGEGED